MAFEQVTLRDGSGGEFPLLPPGQIVDVNDHQTPADFSGSLLFEGVEDRPSYDGGRMPTDALTGLPHAILPFGTAVSHWGPLDINYHHHFYNRRHPDLEGEQPFTAEQLARPEAIPLDELAGLAVRMSRGQRMPVWLHQRAHRRFPVGPVLPHTVDEKFLTAVKACSGVVSRWAIDPTAPDDDLFVSMSDRTFERVASPKVLCTERVYHDKPANTRRRVLGNFFLRYAANQDLSHISEHRVDEFLNTTDDHQRRAVGNYILREAMEVGLEPVAPEYRDLKAAGMVHPGRPGTLQTAIWKYVHPDSRALVFPELAQRLSA